MSQLWTARSIGRAKAKLMVAKAKVAKCKHGRLSRCTAITVGNGVTWKRIAPRWQQGKGEDGKGNVPSSLEDAEASGQEDASLGGFG